MPKSWKIRSKNHNDIVEELLKLRGIKTDKEKEEFFNPTLENYKDFFNFKGIKSAVERINQAKDKGELIIIYGDYDVDGLCATAVMYFGLTKIGAKVLPYIPHREKEGYGLSKEGLDLALEKGAALVVTVDNGIVAIKQAEYAKEIGLDLVITDHHSAGDELPKALSIIHSTKVCGTAVAWGLVRALIGEDSDELLDLVGIATICDMMELVGVNRALVKEGLKRLRSSKNVGLKALFAECELDIGDANAFHISHILGPRINAIGRLDHSIDALRLLCTKDSLKARQLARKLCEVNDRKKSLTSSALEQAALMVKDNKEKILVLESEEWIPGIIGLLAAKTAEELKKPAIVISKGEELSKGSARSVNGLDIIEMLRSFSDLFIDIGGHPQAAGFTIKTSQIPVLKNKLNEFMENLNLDHQEELEIDLQLERKDLVRNILDRLNNFEPYGIGNPQPIFASYNLKLDEVKKVGENKHLKLKVDGIDAIGFSLGDWGDLLKVHQNINLAYCLDLNKFNGKEILQLKIIDLKLS